MIKKALTYSVVITTIIWSVGLLATPLAVGAAVSGDLIKLQCATGAGVSDPCKAVYYLGADGKRYVFPNEKTYKTWYSDFSGVKVITDIELANIPIGGNVTYKPGVKMVKITTSLKVYAVAKNGTLRWVTSEAVATALYGSDCNKKIDDVPDAFFAGNYCTKDSSPTCTVSSSDITDASQFDKTAVMNAATSINDDKNLAAGGTTGGGSVTVSLAADNPPSTLAVESAARLPMTKVVLTNNTALDAVV